MTTVAEVDQHFDQEPKIFLYQMDLTSLGSSDILYFTATTDENSSAIIFDGQLYTPIPIIAEGFEWSGQGSLPTPKLSVGNELNGFNSLNILYHDLVGVEVTRISTYRRFLDDGSEPNPESRHLDEIYRINQKIGSNGVLVMYELTPHLNQEGKKLPGRIFLTSCDHRYRIWDANSSAFIYQGVTCPYAGESSFDREGVSASPSNDVCGKSIGDCQKRFDPDNLGLVVEFRGCPGLSTLPR